MRLIAAPDFTTLRERLARELLAIRSDSLTPIRIVIPRGILRADLLAFLARRLHGVLGIEVVPWSRWIDELTEDELTRAGGRRLSEAGFERLVARVLTDRARSRQGIALRAAAGAPGTARLLAATFADLLEGGFAPDDFLRMPFPPRDVVRRELPALFRDFVRAAEEERLFDRRRQEFVASRVAPTERSPLLLWGFHDVTPLQSRIVEAHALHRPVTLLVPGPSDARDAGESAAAPLLGWARALGASFELCEREPAPQTTIEDGLFDAPAIRDPGPHALEIATYATESEEVRAIAGRILDDVALQGRTFRQFLITLSSRAGPSALLFRRIFAKAGIPLVDAAGVSGASTIGGRRAILLARGQGGAGADAGLEFLAPEERASPEASAAAEEFLRAREGTEVIARFRELHVARLLELPAPEVDQALEAIDLVHGARPVRPRDFASLLRATLAAVRVRNSGGDGVLLVNRDASRGIGRPVVFHAGLVRGAFRRPAAEDPVLRDAARRALADRFAHEGKRLPIAEERRAERLLLARFSLETATEIAILSFAVRDRVGGEVRNPSGLVHDLASARAGRPLEDLAPMQPAARRDARLRPVDRTELDLARFSAERATAADLADILAEPRARHLPRVLRGSESRWGDDRLGPWDGVLEDARARALLDGMLGGSWSASALEEMANCPFAFLLRKLGLADTSDVPDDYNPRDRGSLFHDLIWKLYEALHADGLLPLTPASLPGAIAALDVWHRRTVDRLAGEPILRRLHRRATLAGLRNDAALVLAREAHRPDAERTAPIAFETAFGGEPERPAPAFALPHGSLPLRGRVDRVDRRPDGRLEVVDFKTGVKRARSGKLRRTHEGKTEIHLQLPLYMEALTQLYQTPVARAVLYHATADQSFAEIEYTAEHLARDHDDIGRVLAHVVERARAGWFPCTPSSGRCCRMGLARACGPSVAERFARKRDDPELAAHLALVGGTAPDDVATDDVQP